MKNVMKHFTKHRMCILVGAAAVVAVFMLSGCVGMMDCDKNPEALGCTVVNPNY